MTYSYENLGEDRFQHLCQALLTVDHADVQCLPVGQPDGGRDAFIWQASRNSRNETVVFQVKYSKNPSSKDERIVIEELIKTEASKIAALRAHGLQRYYLLTNVAGTSHYESGSIDRVNSALSEAFDIPTFCFWRDDLDRRVDANSSIKWSFPEILRGVDILQALYEGQFGKEEERRLTTIKAYLSYQYKYDSQLKFKQVDLEKGLVDLFVDVPAAAIGPAAPRERDKWRERFGGNPIFSALAADDQRRYGSDDEDRIGAVRALVDVAVTTSLPRIVIEGAPGQGKSTVTQFLCQLHRMVLLKKWEIARVPDELKPSDVRLPLRVDLRDYATWLSGRSPFQDPNVRDSIESFSPALESFLAAQIAAQSGGLQFTPDDLLAFAAKSALLIVLDGFDEVADISTRNRLVREISDASTRLEGNSISNQMIVTSRPAAFANSPGFPRNEWQYIQILPLTKNVIKIYTEKWISGHNLDVRERKEITTVLEEKLEYPHVRELARNPMQLAILLALISTQGASLPDKRTTLYDRYIDIFFNRESEKSKVVRDKRDLLVDMHRYLAWTLQVEAESDAKAGNISEQRLREVLRSYLTEMGHDPSLIDSLFVGMVERVVALVSRVQGTFEFEVQPLREYFAARYLYDTAPYVQAGSLRSGSIMDRFDALARNAYWLNVTRFYCGCYSTGELPSLVDGLISIGQSEQYSGTTYINELAITLLGDYVFSQQPRSVTRLTDYLFQADRFRIFLASHYQNRNGNGTKLPEGSGRGRLLETAIEAYKHAQHFDTAFVSAGLIKANLDGADVLPVWEEARGMFPPDQALHFGSFLDVLEVLPKEELITLVRAGGDKALRICVYRDRWDVLTFEPDLWRQLFKLSLDGRAAWMSFRRDGLDAEVPTQRAMRFVIALVGALCSLNVEEERFQARNLFEHARRYGPAYDVSSLHLADDKELAGDAVLGTAIMSVATTLASRELRRTSGFEHEVSEFLSLLVEQEGYRSLLSDAAIATLDWFQRGPEMMLYTGIFSELAEMKRYAPVAAWWNLQFLTFDGRSDANLLLKAYLAWAPDDVVRETTSGFSALVDSLSSEDFHILYGSRGNKHSPYAPPTRENLNLGIGKDDCQNIGVRAAALLTQRVGPADRDVLFIEVLVKYFGFDEDISDARSGGAWHYASGHPDFWPSALAIVAMGYSQGVALDKIFAAPPSSYLPMLEAKKIAQEPGCYPLTVVDAAEKSLAEKTGAQVIPVGSVAAREQWFIDEEYN